MSEDKLYAMRHSLAHIMAAAVQRVWPDAKFGVGPVVESMGFITILILVKRRSVSSSSIKLKR